MGLCCCCFLTPICAGIGGASGCCLFGCSRNAPTAPNAKPFYKKTSWLGTNVTLLLTGLIMYIYLTVGCLAVQNQNLYCISDKYVCKWDNGSTTPYQQTQMDKYNYDEYGNGGYGCCEYGNNTITDPTSCGTYKIGQSCINKENMAECQQLVADGCNVNNIIVMESCPVQFACGGDQTKSGNSPPPPPPPPLSPNNPSSSSCLRLTSTVCIKHEAPRSWSLLPWSRSYQNGPCWRTVNENYALLGITAATFLGLSLAFLTTTLVLWKCCPVPQQQPQQQQQQMVQITQGTVIHSTVIQGEVIGIVDVNQGQI